MDESGKFDFASLLLCGPKDAGDEAILGGSHLRELRAYHCKPRLSHVFEVGRMARIGVIWIPCSWMEAFADKEKLLDAAVQGAVFAASMGARICSMTGVIPAASSGGLDVTRRLREMGVFEQYPLFQGVTHGHETVAAAFLLNMRRILAESGRSMHHERLAFVGLGHIGEATLYLTLEARQFPAHLILCDTEAKRERIERIAANVQDRYGIQPQVLLTPPGGALPDEVYSATFFAGSVSVSKVIQVHKLQPGSLIVDDSYPPAVDVELLAMRNDILFAVAGALEGDDIISVRDIAEDFPLGPEAILASIEEQRVTDRCMTGCIFSSFLNGYFALPLEQGPVHPAGVLRRYRTLKKMGYRGTPFYAFRARTNAALVQGNALRGVIFYNDKYVTEFAKKWSARSRL